MNSFACNEMNFGRTKRQMIGAFWSTRKNEMKICWGSLKKAEKLTWKARQWDGCMNLLTTVSN